MLGSLWRSSSTTVIGEGERERPYVRGNHSNRVLLRTREWVGKFSLGFRRRRPCVVALVNSLQVVAGFLALNLNAKTHLARVAEAS